MNIRHDRFFCKFLTFALLLLASNVLAARMGPHLERIIESDGAKHAEGRLAATFKRKVAGQDTAFVHVFIEADTSVLPRLKSIGVEINTVTSSGIMTAIVPVARLRAVAAVSGVRRIEAAQTVKKMMNISAAETGVNLPDTGYPRNEYSGEGVIIGVIDTGIDIEHPDFRDASGNTRILSIWDHTLDAADVGGMAKVPDGFTYGTEWTTEQIQGGYTTCAHEDTDGHGTHVAGTAGGNDSSANGHSYAGPYTGLAPDAQFLIVKFDFDNVKDRNTETAILDGINWIFQQAEAAGKPCVINMSLGSDYGPHDGSTAEERGIDDLTGPGKIICIAAGNAGSSWEGPSFETHGGPIHGSGLVSTTNDIVFSIPDTYEPAGEGGSDYVFFDIWYPGNSAVYVQITAPDGTTYPQSYSGRNRKLWYTDGQTGGFGTPDGFIYVENLSGANSFWETANGDNNIYIEISDYQGIDPAAGTWTVNIYPVDANDAEYHSWQGFSDSLRHSFFWYDGGLLPHLSGDPDDPFLANNEMTIGKPASAFSAIAIGAYQTKASWPAREYLNESGQPVSEMCEEPDANFQLMEMAYGTPPIDYYNEFFLQDLAYFSSRGPTRDGRIEPFITAPGVGIVASYSQINAAIPGDNYFRCMNRVEFGGYHAVLQGTSMACPHGTGSVAVLLGEASGEGNMPSPAEIKEMLRLGANKDSFTGLSSNQESADNNWGYGKIDVTAALENLHVTPDAPPRINSCEPDTGAWNTSMAVTISGSHFIDGAAVSFGAGITVDKVSVVDSQTITCTIYIARKTKRGAHDIVVVNPDGQQGVLIDGFTVTRR